MPIDEQSTSRAAGERGSRQPGTSSAVSHEGAVRFNEFLQALGSIPPATLARRLADLEEAGVFERAVIDARPPWVEYHLTQRGRQLRSLVNALARFAETGARADNVA